MSDHHLTTFIRFFFMMLFSELFLEALINNLRALQLKSSQRKLQGKVIGRLFSITVYFLGILRNYEYTSVSGVKLIISAWKMKEWCHVGSTTILQSLPSFIPILPGDLKYPPHSYPLNLVILRIFDDCL